MSQAAVLYHEPDVVTILTQSSFVLALNVIDYGLDKVINCGLIGQILIGMAYGTPGADILGPDFQQAITDLGYLGLILIVFEGGLSTNMKALRSNLVLSTFVALTGILLPIGLSFLLMKISSATILQAFAAGCALSSTSLGTTFTILKTSNLHDSRLGVVLTSAAMLDDIVGLVLVQVIANLGASPDEGISAATIVRPVFVSFGYALIVPVILFVFLHIGSKLKSPSSKAKDITRHLGPQIRFVCYTLILIGAVSSAAYAGTSVLFAAYLAGLLISSGEGYRKSWEKNSKKFKRVTAKESPRSKSVSHEATVNENTNESWEMVSTKPEASETRDQISNIPSTNPSRPKQTTERKEDDSDDHNSSSVPLSAPTDRRTSMEQEQGIEIYELYYGDTVQKILKGFFFASIGLSIPITRLFQGATIWRGFVYFILMTFGKLACGTWLVRFSSSSTSTSASPENGPPSTSSPASQSQTQPNGISPTTAKSKSIWVTLTQYKAQSLYPAAVLGSAMVARGEIGFLISAIAQTNGIFTPDPSSDASKGDLFLIVTWAILLCTIVGPIVVGSLTRRVKKLRGQVDRSGLSGGSGSIEGRRRDDPLGVWADL